MTRAELNSFIRFALSIDTLDGDTFEQLKKLLENYFLETGDEDKEPDGAAYIEKAMAVAEKFHLEITGLPLG